MKIGEIDPPFFILGKRVALVNETIQPPIFLKIALVVFAVLLVRDLLIDLQKGGKLGVSGSVGVDGSFGGSTGKILGHVAHGNGDGLAGVKLDEICALGLRDSRVHGDIHDRAAAQCLDRLTEVIDSRPGRERFILTRDGVPVESTEEPPIILEIWVEGAREPMRIDAVIVRLVVLLVARIVDLEGIRRHGAADDDAIHGIRLILGPLLVAIVLMVEIADGEEGHPCATVSRGAVGEEEWRGKLPQVLGGDHETRKWLRSPPKSYFPPYFLAGGQRELALSSSLRRSFPPRRHQIM
mmetsp:Transcript_44336/g.94370  ORF Transcript_44336/g.94370 Transcript_44336/m.94370 type:complete len:296 (+) Transcript_44336:695-1582(+)